MAKIFVCGSTKGGVSKTTTTVNLAAACAEMGYKVLVVDFDPQGHSSKALNVDGSTLELTLTDVMMPGKTGEKEPIEKVIYETDVPNLHLAPSSLRLTLVNLALSGAVARERFLAKELRKPAIMNRYDFIFIDTNPATDILLINALAASDYLIACSKSEFSSLDGVEMMLDQMQMLKDSEINPGIRLLGVMVSHRRKTAHDKKTLQSLKDRYKVLGCTAIRTEVNDAFEKGVPVVCDKPESDASKEYRRVANDLIRLYESDQL